MSSSNFFTLGRKTALENCLQYTVLSFKGNMKPEAWESNILTKDTPAWGEAKGFSLDSSRLFCSLDQPFPQTHSTTHLSPFRNPSETPLRQYSQHLPWGSLCCGNRMQLPRVLRNHFPKRVTSCRIPVINCPALSSLRHLSPPS